MADPPTPDERKRRGAWYTPPALVQRVVTAVIDAAVVHRHAGGAIRVLDPACGDGRFLEAAGRRIVELGGRVELFGVDVDPDAVAATRERCPDANVVHADALAPDTAGSWAPGVDLVVGNPPYLSQLAAATTRGRASRLGGGPYADAAVEFLALAADAVRPDGGRVALVLPQSILSARDAAPVRRSIDARARLVWSSWTGERDFDAQVHTCALAFEFAPRAVGDDAAAFDGAVASGSGSWARVVTERIGVPPVPAAMAASSSTLGDLGWLNANFRDEYYGMIPAVGDHDEGPPLVTSGLIDPGRCLWGRRPVRFAKRRFDAPRLDLEALDDAMTRWARRRLVPKVLIANQTPVLEAVADPGGDWLPGVPVVSVYPHGGDGADGPADVAAASRRALEIAAVLTSPAASAWAWHERGGSGLSADTIRVGPTMLAALPWPSGDVGPAVDALGAGDVLRCGELVDAAYGIEGDEHESLMAWWLPIVERIEIRSARPG